jgi:hypothetical protein
MMEKSPKSRSEIECLVLHELQTSGSCEGASAISVVDWHYPGNDTNWTVAAFKPGTSGIHQCELALQSIVPRLQGFYELVQKH